MLRVACLPIGAAASLGPLSPSLAAYADKAQGERARTERCAGMHLLDSLYREMTGAEPPPVALLPGGKPTFAKGEMGFSISHAGRLVAVALSEGEVGLDLEPYASMDEGRARRFASLLSEGERRLVATAPDPLRATLEIYVRREALVKKSGEGLSALRRTDTAALPPPRHEERPRDDEGREYYLCVY